MIRTEAEYKNAVRRLQEEEQRFVQHRERLERSGVTGEALTLALDPLRSFSAQLREEIESYERLCRGDVGELHNLHGLGQLLVALRIALNMSQRDLAERLGVHESQVSRDERNDYHGITVARATRILDALGVGLVSRFAEPVIAKKPDDPLSVGV